MREALSAFRRAPLLTGMSAAMIGLSLFLVGLFGLAAYNIKRVLDRVEQRVEIVAYLRDDAAPASITAAQREIEQYPEVREVLYISREQALRKAQAELPEFRTIFAGLDSNPLPASLEVALQPNQEGPQAVESVAQRLAAFPFVEDVRYGSEWLDKVYLLQRVAGAATLILGGAFAIVAALIIGAAVRMAIYARRDEISIMRLVGATDGFIRRPFLLEGCITGLLGATAAVVLTFVVFDLLSGSLIRLEWLPDAWVLGGVAVGIVLGVLSSAVAVRRYLGEA
ncbi:MAG: cell division protein FtsX [Longimicrobiales bacterium]